MRFRLRDDCPLWCAVPRASTNTRLCDFRRARHGPEETVLQPPAGNACPLTPARFGLIPFRSPLLRESRLISFPRGTEMFQFPRLPSRPMYSARDNAALPAPGFPIRRSTGQRLFSASPWLIAAVHVLLRLLVPRHPPCALTILTVIGEFRLGRSTHRNQRYRVTVIAIIGQLCSFQGPARGARHQRALPETARSLKTKQHALEPLRHSELPVDVSGSLPARFGRRVLRGPPASPIELPARRRRAIRALRAP